MSVLRRVLPPEKSRRGWCPSLARPMPTGDGLLARVHPPLGLLSLAQARAVAEGARRFGNGHVDVTARGNLQIRGMRSETVCGLAARLSEAGLGDRRGDGGPQRLTLTSPLAGLDPDEAIDVTALARAIESEGLRIPELPAKTLVAIIGAGVSDEGADIVVRPAIDGGFEISLAASAHDTIRVASAGAAEAVAAMLHVFVATGRRRVRDLSGSERTALRRAGEDVARGHPPPPSAGEGGPRFSEGRERGKPFLERAFPSPACSAGTLPRRGGRVLRAAPAADVPIGFGVFGAVMILAVETPFGRSTADALDRLADTADRIAAPDIRTTPARGFVLACGSCEAAKAALETLAAAGFVTKPHDPRRAIAACPGAPACTCGTTPVPDHAARLAKAFAPFAARGLAAHVSGCAKGCAHPGPADLTLVAEDGRYGVVLHGDARRPPALHLTFEAALERVRRADPAAPLADAFHA